MKTKALTDVTVECDPPHFYAYGKTEAERIESRARQLDAWADEFNDFIRDHRSRDDVSLSVNRVYSDVCSHCMREWDVSDEGEPQCCDKAQKEWEAEKANA